MGTKRTEVTRRSYTVELTIKQFIAVEKRDDRDSTPEYGLLTLLERAYASHIEYNGHFGAAIHYTLDVEDDTPLRREIIEEVILDYAKGHSIPRITEKLLTQKQQEYRAGE